MVGGLTARISTWRPLRKSCDLRHLSGWVARASGWTQLSGTAATSIGPRGMESFQWTGKDGGGLSETSAIFHAAWTCCTRPATIAPSAWIASVHTVSTGSPLVAPPCDRGGGWRARQQSPDTHVCGHRWRAGRRARFRAAAGACQDMRRAP